MQSSKNTLGPGHWACYEKLRWVGACWLRWPWCKPFLPLLNCYSFEHFLLSNTPSPIEHLLFISETWPKFPSQSILWVTWYYNCLFTSLFPRLDCKFFKLKKYLCLPSAKHIIVNRLMQFGKIYYDGGSNMDWGLSMERRLIQKRGEV